MARENILEAIGDISRDKGIDRDKLVTVIQEAVTQAAKRKFKQFEDIEARINEESGELEVFRYKTVAENPDDLDNQIPLEEARKLDSLAEPGDEVEYEIDNKELSRVIAQTARQLIFQKIREAERETIYENFKDRVGEVLHGIVSRTERGRTFVTFNQTEAILYRREQIPHERYSNGDHIRVILLDVLNDPKEPSQLVVSRADPDLLIKLFDLEVPEVYDGIVEIVDAAREPGRRAKIAVRSNNRRTDPIGACVGMRGSRVQAVSNELAGERIDIILWDENPAQFVINAMAPAEVASIVVDEESQTMDVAVEESNLSQAIGRGGQNVRLASELSGWELNVLTLEQAEQKSEEEAKKILDRFMERLDVGEDVANILVQEGFSNIEEVAYVPESELLEIEEFDEDIVNEIRRRARDALLTQLIAKEEVLDENRPQEDLMNLEGMTERLAYRLADKGLRTQEDLAELSVDELQEIDEISDEAAAELIMTARAPWFAEEE